MIDNYKQFTLNPGNIPLAPPPEGGSATFPKGEFNLRTFNFLLSTFISNLSSLAFYLLSRRKADPPAGGPFTFIDVSWCTLFLFVFSCSSQKADSANIADVVLNDSDSYFYVDTKNYPATDQSLPIGVFDSGTGGLTVLDAIIKFDQHNNQNGNYNESGDGMLDFQKEYFIYLGDKANMPYGNYSQEDNVALLKEHIIKDVQFLMDTKYYPDAGSSAYRSDKKPVKAIVIACNTATAYGKTDVEQLMKKAELDIKVIGVIDAGVRGALANMVKDAKGTIGVMATAGTVSSKGYVKAVKKWSKELGYSGQIEVVQQAGIGLAGAIDGSADYISSEAIAPREIYKGPAMNFPDALIDPAILENYGFNWKNSAMLFRGNKSKPENIQINSVENYIVYHVTSLLEKIRKSDNPTPLKSIILGCTHYPFYMGVFKRHLQRLYNFKKDGKYVYRSLMNEEINLIDPAINTAKELYAFMKESALFNDADLSNSEFYISVSNRENSAVITDSLANFTYKYKYGRNAGEIQQYVKRVPFSRSSLPETTIERLKTSVPLVFELIRAFNKDNPKLIEIPDDDKI